MYIILYINAKNVVALPPNFPLNQNPFGWVNHVWYKALFAKWSDSDTGLARLTRERNWRFASTAISLFKFHLAVYNQVKYICSALSSSKQTVKQKVVSNSYITVKFEFVFVCVGIPSNQ